MNVKQMNDFQYDVALGRIDRVEKLWKFGEGNVSTTPTTVWKGSVQQPGLYIYPDQAYIMDAVSDNIADNTQTMIIQGLDKHWKLQEELVQLNGTTPVSTIYEYIRINRLSILGGGGLVGNVEVTQTGTTSPIYSYIADGNFERNQTQQAFVTIAVGHSFLAESIDISSFSGRKTNLYVVARNWKAAEDLGLIDPPFRVQANWNLFNSTFQVVSNVPIKVGERTDFEARGYTENATDSVTSVLQGVLVQERSVPIDLGNFSAIAGTESIIVSWDLQTPAETSDMANFVVDIYSNVTNKLVVQKILTDKDSVGVTVNGLVTGVEYKVNAYWVGYDGRRSTIESANVTPI